MEAEAFFAGRDDLSSFRKSTACTWRALSGVAPDAWELGAKSLKHDGVVRLSGGLARGTAPANTREPFPLFGKCYVRPETIGCARSGAGFGYPDLLKPLRANLRRLCGWGSRRFVLDSSVLSAELALEIV